MKYVYLINNDNIFEKVNITKDKEILEDIYYLKYKVPTINDIKNSNNLVKTFYKENNLENIKKKISNVKEKIPLFNVYHYNIYLIDKDKVYSNVTYENYRFPDNITVDNMKKKYQEIDAKDDVTKRNKRKIKLMLYFLEQLDYEELYRSYLNAYISFNPYYINEITNCEKPSFINEYKHLTPYYTRLELINLSKNMNLDLDVSTLNDPEKINEICKIVNDNDINKKILIDHNDYINKENMQNFLSYYTIQGSNLLNNYLRNFNNIDNTDINLKNKYIENIIIKMYNFLKNSPKFDKDYYVYRFVDNNFLDNLKEGDEFIEKGFLSTTRNPFYVPKSYKFGKILMKIKIPKNKIGVALCIETISKFPEEQEIIFPPNTKLRLISKNKDFNYYHIDDKYQNSIKIKYEFEYVSCLNKPKFEEKILEEEKFLDFNNLNSNNIYSFKDKIINFLRNLENNKYFNTKIGKKNFYIITEIFDSTSSYNRFYSLSTSYGLSLYTFYKNNILFFIEIAEIGDTLKLHVNYYLSNLGYSELNREEIINDNDFLYFISQLAKYFIVDDVLIYSDYVNCNSDNINNSKGYLSKDIYNYLKFNKKRFEKIDKINIYPEFSYFILDELKNINPLKILKKEDNDELYQIYLRIYPKDKNNISDLYIWISENYCQLLKIYISKFERLYENPFLKISYKFNFRNYIFEYYNNTKLIS